MHAQIRRRPIRRFCIAKSRTNTPGKTLSTVRSRRWEHAPKQTPKPPKRPIAPAPSCGQKVLTNFGAASQCLFAQNREKNILRAGRRTGTATIFRGAIVRRSAQNRSEKRREHAPQFASYSHNGPMQSARRAATLRRRPNANRALTATNAPCMRKDRFSADAQ